MHKLIQWGEFKFINYYDGDEFPLLKTKIDNLRIYFDKESQNGKVRAYSIAFDCLTKKEKSSEKTDAIAIQCVSIINNQKTTYYFPYTKEDFENINFGESWAENNE